MTQWHYYPKAKPTQEGDYFVASWTWKTHGRHRQRLTFINHYTPDKGFDFDLTMSERQQPERVYAWLEIPPTPPLPNKELLSGANNA